MVSVTVDDQGITAALERSPAVVTKTVTQRFRSLGGELVRFIRGEQLSGQLLTPRTGTGRRSIFYRIEASASGVSLIVGADLGIARYMRAQEEGATITPKSGQYLTIPIGQAKTGNGVARFTAKELIANPGAFGYVETFFRNSILFGVKTRVRRGQAIGGYGSIEPLFVLKRQVRLRPVGYLSSALNTARARTDEIERDIEQTIVDLVERGLDRGAVIENTGV